MRCKRMPERVRRDVFGDMRAFNVMLQDPTGAPFGERTSPRIKEHHAIAIAVIESGAQLAAMARLPCPREQATLIVQHRPL